MQGTGQSVHLIRMFAYRFVGSLSDIYKEKNATPSYRLHSVAQLDACPTGDQEVAGATPAGSAIFFRGDHEIFSTVILSLPLIQEGQLSIGSCQFLAKECAQYWLTA